MNSRARPNPLRFPEIDAWNLALQRALTPGITFTMAYVGNKGTYTLGDSSGNTTNPNEAAITLPASLSTTGQTLHWDPSVPAGTISPERRYRQQITISGSTTVRRWPHAETPTT